MKTYKQFIKLLERAPSIPVSEETWKKRGKVGKKVMLFSHNDLDGIYSAIVIKGWLESKGFEIIGYGIVEYTDSWNLTKIDPEVINVAVDFAEFPENTGDDYLIFIDHHGDFSDPDVFGLNIDISKQKHAIKTKTGSAYEGICLQLGIPINNSVLSIIDMIDSAKYDDYKVDIKTILHFNLGDFKNKLEFAGAFNQLIKRADYKTIIEVIANHKGYQPSIYTVFELFKRLYPANNLDTNTLKKFAKDFHLKIGVKPSDKIDMTVDEFVQKLKDDGRDDLIAKAEKDFVEDARKRMYGKRTRTQGSISKTYIKDQDDFKRKFMVPIDKKEEDEEEETTEKPKEPIKEKTKIALPGYQILGQMIFVPTGSWSNALTARAFVEEDLNLNSEWIPVIEYEIMNDSVNYEGFRNMNNQERELVGDIDNTNATIYKLSVKEDVTDNDKIEGIKGIIQVKPDKIIFKAKQPLFWVMLQYGNTLQVASFHKFENYVEKYLPKINGEPVKDLGKYCIELKEFFQNTYGYNPLIAIANLGKETLAGGHKGIGTISNIFGKASRFHIQKRSEAAELDGVKFLDMFKNKMIQDLSLIPWPDLKMSWNDEEGKFEEEERIMNKRVMMMDQIRKIDLNVREE